MIARLSHRWSIGLATCLAASSLAMGAIASPATGAPATPTVQPAAANIQPRAGGSFDDTYSFNGAWGVSVQNDNAATKPNPATLAVDFGPGDDTVYVANAWLGTVEAIAAGQLAGVTAPRVQVGTVVPRDGSFPSSAKSGEGLFGIAVDATDDTVYVVNRGQAPMNSYIWAINGRTMTVDDTKTLSGCSGTNPNAYGPEFKAIAVDSALNRVYVPCRASAENGSASVLAIDGSSLTVIHTYTLANYVFSGIFVDSTGNVLVSGWGGGTSSVRKLTSSLTLANTWTPPFGKPSAVVSADDSMYVASFDDSVLWVRSVSTAAQSTVPLDGKVGWQGLAYKGGPNPMVFVGSDKIPDQGLKSVYLRDLSVRTVSGRGTASLAVTSQGLLYAGNHWDSQFTYGKVFPYAQVPDVPAAPMGSAGIQQVDLTWTAPGSSIPLTSYKVTASPGGASCTTTPPATSCTISPLTAGTAYTFTLQARNDAGWSSASVASAPVIPNAYPGAPTGVLATAGVQAANVSWTPPVNAGYPATVTAYRVTANPGGALCTATPPATTCTVSPLTAGTAYTFTVEAENSTGWGSPSAASAPVTPLAPPPPTPVANMQLTMASSPARFEKAGDVLTITATVFNSGTDTLNAVQVRQGSIPLTCTPGTPLATLPPGESIVCRGTRTVTEADSDAGVVRDRVTASATAGLTGAPLSATAVLDVQGPPPPERLQLRVVMNSSPAAFTRKGERLSFTALVTNTGNVPVRDVIITGSPIDLVCTPSSPLRSLPAKGTMRCAGTYEVTKADMSAGVIRGLTRATGSAASGARIASTGAVEVSRTSPEKASLKVTMSSTPESFRRAGQTLTLKAIATNRGDVPLTNVTVTGTPGRFTCEPRTPVANLEVDAKVTCTAKYDVSAADVRAGVIRATVKASGISAKGAATSDDVVIRIKEASPPRGRSMSYLVPRLVW